LNRTTKSTGQRIAAATKSLWLPLPVIFLVVRRNKKDIKEKDGIVVYITRAAQHGRIGRLEMGIFDGLFKQNIQNLKNKRDYDRLFAALRDKNIREEAAQALSDLGHKDADWRLLKAALEDDNEFVRAWAAAEFQRDRWLEGLNNLLGINKESIKDYVEYTAAIMVHIGLLKAYILGLRKSGKDIKEFLNVLINALKFDDAVTASVQALLDLNESHKAIESLISVMVKNNKSKHYNIARNITCQKFANEPEKLQKWWEEKKSEWGKMPERCWVCTAEIGSKPQPIWGLISASPHGNHRDGLRCPICFAVACRLCSQDFSTCPDCHQRYRY